ncbi:MAG: nucleotide exchange factor GrpE [Ignavibacteria bacterium]
MKKNDKHKDHAEENELKDKVNVDIKDKASEEQPNELEILKKEVNFYKDALMRKAAEFENYKKRSDTEISNYIKYASEGLIKSILPVYEDLTRSMESVEKGETKDFETLKQGVQLVTDKFNNTLTSEGLTEIDILGKEFDVNTCDALLQVPRDDIAPHTVVEVVEKGYKLKDKVIKFAKVIVSTEKE